MDKDRVEIGYQIDFSKYCPHLKDHSPTRPVQLFFSPDTAIASETSCPQGGLPGVEQRSDSGFLVPINPDRIIVYCAGCQSLNGGFEKELDK
jgi:hypothetical protein